MSIIRKSLVATCWLIFSLSATAQELMQATNAELWELYSESESAEEAEQLIKNWIDGYINGFESAYRLEMASDEGNMTERKSCVSKHDTELIYLMLVTAGVKESTRDLLVVDTMYLILRFGCQDIEALGALPSWITAGGYDKLGVHIPEDE